MSFLHEALALGCFRNKVNIACKLIMNSYLIYYNKILDSAASSVSWRLSPSSSGYKTQSQRSESVTPSPTSTPYLSGQDSTNSVATNTSETQIEDDQRDTQVVWAVTDIQSVPKGSIIINPQVISPFFLHVLKINSICSRLDSR